MSKSIDQKKFEYLSCELSNARQAHLNKFSFPDTDDVKAARSILNRFNDRRNKAQAKHRLAVSTAADKIREAILFGDHQKTLDAIRKFERKVFK